MMETDVTPANLSASFVSHLFTWRICHVSNVVECNSISIAALCDTSNYHN